MPSNQTPEKDKPRLLRTSDVEELSNDPRLDRLLKSVLTEVKRYAEDQIQHIRKLTRIGLALSIEKNIGKLLELIVDEARELSHADAGTLYILDPSTRHLRFEIFQTASMNIRMGGSSEMKAALPHVPLFDENRPNFTNVSSFVALTGNTVNIPDVYQADGFDFTGTRLYDQSTGYKSKSMLVIPMKNHENIIIGVLQLLNAVDPESGEIVGFSPEYVDLIASLASQAAIALTNTRLNEDLKNLFYAFIKSIATAIDEKSPYTGGHIKRVVELTMIIAEHINSADRGKFKDVVFNESELEELRLAAWMHDVGKITTPEHIIDKSVKLEGITNGITIIRTRFDLIETLLKYAYLTQKAAVPEYPAECGHALSGLKQELDEKIAGVRDDFEFIRICNEPGRVMTDGEIDRIKKIAEKSYTLNNEVYPYLTDAEVAKLSIRKGTLDDSERKIIENHARMTEKILKQIPFPDRLANVPKYAAGHHEKPDGNGYPNGLSGQALPLQSRILAVADIFEALSACDRPYKDRISLEKALSIMDSMKDENHIDADVYEIFRKNGLYRDYLMSSHENIPEKN